MKTRLILLFLALFAGKMLYDAGAPMPPEETSRRAGNVQAEHAALATGVGARLLHGLGVYGAKLAAPAVQEMVTRHALQLKELEVAIRKAPSVPKARARGVVDRIETLDSLAVARLAEGHPVAALKFSMQSGGLLDAARQHVLEEAIIR